MCLHIRQCLLSPKFLHRLKSRLTDLASPPDDDEGSKTLNLKKAQFANVRADIDRVSRNKALP